MTLDYTITTAAGSLRTIHKLTVNGESIETTRQKEILVFAKPRIASKYVWKQLKDAVRLGERLQLAGGTD